MKNETLQEIKVTMGYVSDKEVCMTCTYFVDTDCSGRHDALPMHCELNAFTLPVEGYGRCHHWKHK